jgi:GNAT superfamily N-acetyltransferase
MNLTAYEPGTDLPPGMVAAVQELFRASYHRYHYLAEVASTDRIKIVATAHDRVCGYASASRAGKLYRLANLLVDLGSRGAGLGRRLERVRYDYVRDRGISCYVSCTCEDTTSQVLKLDLGMRPVAFKIGYRADVVRAGERGSAVVFTDSPIEVAEPRHDSIVRNDVLRRTRYVSADPKPEVLAVLPADDFAEVLTGSAGLRRMARMPGFRLAGHEYDAVDSQWHYCFQACNAAYEEGVRQQPAVAVMPERPDVTL